MLEMTWSGVEVCGVSALGDSLTESSWSHGVIFQFGLSQKWFSNARSSSREKEQRESRGLKNKTTGGRWMIHQNDSPAKCDI